MGRPSIIPSNPQFDNFEQLCLEICNLRSSRVLQIAGLSGTIHTNLKKYKKLPTTRQLELDKGAENGCTSVVGQLGMSATDILFVIEHGCLSYHLWRLYRNFTNEDIFALYLNMKSQHGIDEHENHWRYWLSGREAIPDNILDALLDYFKVSKETLSNYKFIKKDIYELFTKYLEESKSRKMNHYAFVALHGNNRAIIINDRGTYTLLSGNDEEFEKAIMKIMEFHLKDFVDYLNSEEYNARISAPTLPLQPQYVKRVRHPLKTKSSRPKETLDIESIPDTLEVCIEEALKRLQKEEE